MLIFPALRHLKYVYTHTHRVMLPQFTLITDWGGLGCKGLSRPLSILPKEPQLPPSCPIVGKHCAPCLFGATFSAPQSTAASKLDDAFNCLLFYRFVFFHGGVLTLLDSLIALLFICMVLFQVTVFNSFRFDLFYETLWDLSEHKQDRNAEIKDGSSTEFRWTKEELWWIRAEVQLVQRPALTLGALRK